MTPTPTPEAILAAKAEHGSLRAAARALGRSESTLRGILKRAEATAAQEETVVRDETHRMTTAQLRRAADGLAQLGTTAAEATTQLVEMKDALNREPLSRPLNRAERRDEHRRSLRKAVQRRLQRPYRRAFSDWTGTVRSIHGIGPVAA
jgi:molybdenum-dependent DNA-binding transcriptional regulator ModE